MQRQAGTCQRNGPLVTLTGVNVELSQDRWRRKQCSSGILVMATEQTSLADGHRIALGSPGDAKVLAEQESFPLVQDPSFIGSYKLHPAQE